MVCDQARKTTTFKMICLVEDEDERGDPTRFISTTRRNSLAQSMAAGRTLHAKLRTWRKRRLLVRYALRWHFEAALALVLP